MNWLHTHCYHYMHSNTVQHGRFQRKRHYLQCCIKGCTAMTWVEDHYDKEIKAAQEG